MKIKDKKSQTRMVCLLTIISIVIVVFVIAEVGNNTSIEIETANSTLSINLSEYLSGQNYSIEIENIKIETILELENSTLILINISKDFKFKVLSENETKEFYINFINESAEVEEAETNETEITEITNQTNITENINETEIIETNNTINETEITNITINETENETIKIKISSDFKAFWSDNGSLSQSVDGCGELNTTNAIYTLNISVNNTATCFNITANNITLDCQGYTINYSSAGTLGYGVYSNKNFTTIKNCVIKEGTATTNNKYAIYYNKANNGTISNNTIITTGSYGYGIYLLTSNSSTVLNNNITTSGTVGWGIYLLTNANSNTLSNNTITTTSSGTIYGIILSSSNSNTLANNSVIASPIDEEWGLSANYYLTSSSANILTNNKANSSGSSYVIYGTSSSHYNNTIDSSNLAEGKAVNYTYNADNLVFNGVDFTSYGQVIFGWSRNITITNSNFSDDSLNLFYTNLSTITNNNISGGKGHGILLVSSSNSNTISNNTIITSGGSGYGIKLSSSSNSNTLSNNTITTSGSYGGGIDLASSSNSNTLSNNTIITSGSYGYGIRLLGTKSNTLSNNTITTSGTYGYGIRIRSSISNISFSGMNVKTNGTSAYSIFIYDANNNFTISDSILNSSRAGVQELYVRNAVTGGTWNFTNITRTNSSQPINISWTAGANGTLNMHWYLDVNVTNSGFPVQNANVSAWNSAGTFQFSENTTSNGLITTKTLLEYTNVNNTAITYSTPYIINITEIRHSTYSNTSVNFTNNIVLNANMSFENVTPTISYIYPSPFLNDVKNENVTLNVSVSDSSNQTYAFFDDGLVLWMRMDDVNQTGLGSKVYDLSPFGNNGTAYGNATQVLDGKFGKGFSFDGNGDYVDAGGTNSNINFTWAAWIYPYNAGEAANGGTIIAGDAQHYFFIISNKLGYRRNTNPYETIWSSSNTINTGIWYHVTVTRIGNNSGDTKLYINGLQNDSGLAIPDFSVTGSFRIGARGGVQSPFNGTIDDVMIFNRSLSATEIQALYNSSQYYLQRDLTGLSEGSKSYTAQVVDNAGNRNSSTLTFTIDKTAPSINFTGQTEANNSFFNRTWIYVNVSSNDTNNISTFINFDNSLVGWWRMDDVNQTGLGATVYDKSSYGNNGTAYGNASQTDAGKLGKGFSFDGDGDYVDAGNASSLNPTTQATWSFWAKQNTYLNGAGLINKYIAATGRRSYHILTTSNEILVRLSQNGTNFTYYQSSNDCGFTDNSSWINILVVYNSTNLVYYRNGAYCDIDTAIESSLWASPDSLRIGRDYGTAYFNGTIDDVMIFNRSLSAAEIAALYANTSSKYLGVNFTSLVEGRHTFKAYAQDLAGNINQTELRVQTLDITSPNATLLTPAAGYYSNASSVNFTVNISENIGIKNATLKIFDALGNLVNITVITDFAYDVTSRVVGIVVTLADGIYTWFYEIFDWAGNLFITGNRTIIIDTTYPLINFTAPTPENNSGRSNEFQIGVNITELNLANITYNWNSTNYNVQSPKTLLNGLVLMMNFENDSSYRENDTFVYDFSGNGNNGTIINAVYTANGKYGKGMSFDGNGDYVEATNNAQLKPINGTISMWIYSNSLTSSTIYSGAQSGSNDRHPYITLGSSLSIRITNGSAANAYSYAAGFQVNTWYHIAGTWNGTNITFYVNGDLKQINAQTITPIANTAYKARIGSFNPPGYPESFNGTIDEVMIFNRSLSASEILQLYQSQMRKYPTTNSSVSNITRYQMLQTQNMSTGYNITFNLESNDMQNINWSLLINQTGLSTSARYNYFVKAIDLAGNSNQTETRTIIGNTAPTFVSVTFSPNLTDYNNLDPGKEVFVMANISDLDNNFNSAILQWKNSTGDWNNVTMQNISSKSFYTLVNRSFTLPGYEGNITIRIKANDTENDVSYSNNYTLTSFWDCTWSVSPNSLEEVIGFFEDKEVGNITLINTGDVNYFNNNCSISFTLGSIGWTSTYTSIQPTCGNWMNCIPKYLTFSSNPVTVNASSNQTIQINASFPSTTSPFTETPTITITSSINNTITGNKTAQVSSTLVIAPPNPLLYQKIEEYPSTYVYLTTRNFSLKAYVRNLGFDSDNAINTTAHNVSFNWTLDSDLASRVSEGNLTNFYEILNTSARQYNNLTISLTSSNLVSMPKGTLNATIYSYGYKNDSGNFSLIINSGNLTIINETISIEFLCYPVSDGIYVSSCYPTDPDTPPAAEVSVGGGGGAGAVGLGKLSETFFSTKKLELVRGKEQKFELPIKNPFSDAVLQNITIKLEGYYSEYISLSPSYIAKLEPEETKNITVSIVAPAYFIEGSYNLSFEVTAIKIKNLTESDIKEKINVVLNILEITRNQASSYLGEVKGILQYVNSSGYYTKNIALLVSQLEQAYNNLKFTEVNSLYEKIKQIYNNIKEYEKIYSELQNEIKEAEKYGIKTSETKSVIYLAESAFNRGDFEMALKRIQDARLAFAIETKGEFHPLYYAKNHPVQVSLSLVALALFGFGSSLLIRFKLYRRKLKLLDAEENLLIGLMKVIQRECFEKAKLSMGEYSEAMLQYEKRLRSIVQEKISTETKIANLFKLRGKEKALAQERKRLIELIKQTQKMYLEEGRLETRIYENMLRSYSSRLSEVEEQIALAEAQKALKGKKYKLPEEKPEKEKSEKEKPEKEKKK